MVLGMGRLFSEFHGALHNDNFTGCL